MSPNKWILALAVAIAAFAAPRLARADDCLEVGLRDRDGNFEFYHAWVDSFDESRGRVHIKYEHRHGELELKVRNGERADGTDVVVLRGRWFEGRDRQRTGRVRLEMGRRGHRARGWYTFGDDEEGTHYDIVLRDCKRRY